MSGICSRLAAAALAACVGLIAAAPAAAHNSGPGSRSKHEAGGQSSERVIIRARGDVDALGEKVRSRRGRGVRKHRLVSAVSAEVTAEQLAALAMDPDVESISIDAEVRTHASKRRTETTSTEPGFLRSFLGIGTYAGGASVTVAVIDSGLQANADFTGRVVGQWNFVNGTAGVQVTPFDDHGHGTHVAGLIGSSGALSGGKYAGVAAGVRLAALKVLDKNGKGRTSDVIAALEWAVGMKDALGIRVVNLSLGHPVYEPATSDPLVLAVEAATRAGLAVVVAAGNYGADSNTGTSGYAGITSPGNAPSAITVGASNTNGTVALSDDRVASYSSRGPTWYDGMVKPDVVAPGQAMISDASDSSTLESTLTGQLVYETSKKFLKLSGSSMATAVVSGLAALMIDANRMGAEQRAKELYGRKAMNRGDWPRPPELTANAIKALLQYTAVPLRDASGQPYDVLTQGTGEINGLGSLYGAYLADTSQPVGSSWVTTDLQPQTTLSGETLAWSQRIVWGTDVLSGADLLYTRQAAWDSDIVWGAGAQAMVWGALGADDNIVWGTSIFDGFNIVWGGSVFSGDNIVWGSSSYWQFNIVWGTAMLGRLDGDNLVWGTYLGDNIVWGTLFDDNIVWGTDQKIRIFGTPGVIQ